MKQNIQSLQISRYGGPEVLQLRETAAPVLKPGEVRIAVKAAGINFADIQMRMGLYPEAPPPPFAPGFEVAGIILEVGTGVSRLREGDRVMAGSRFSGYASELCLPADYVYPIPENLSFEEAASVPVNFLTAWVVLMELGRVRAGDRVAIHSAAGGVGVAAVQMAVQVGAHVLGLVGSESKIPRVLALGAKEVWAVERWEATADKDIPPFDFILDPVGGPSLKRGYRRLAPAGKVLCYGVSQMVGGSRRSIFRALRFFLNTPLYTPFHLMMANKGVGGANLLKLFETEMSPGSILDRGMKNILNFLRQGRYRPIVGKTFPLSKGGEAQEYLRSRENVGKVVLIP